MWVLVDSKTKSYQIYQEIIALYLLTSTLNPPIFAA